VLHRRKLAQFPELDLMAAMVTWWVSLLHASWTIQHIGVPTFHYRITNSVLVNHCLDLDTSVTKGYLTAINHVKN
jgi:hypothetical protein